MKNIEKFYLINNKKEGYGIMSNKNGSINIDFLKHDLRKGDGIEIILLFKLLISFIFIFFLHIIIF